MSAVTGEVATTDDPDLPFKVTFSIGSRVIAEHHVNSQLSGTELIERLLPTLQGFEPGA